MDSGILLTLAGYPTAQPSSSVSAEICQPQQPILCGAFSALLKDAVKTTHDEQAPALSDVGNPIELPVAIAAGAPATGTSLIEIVTAALDQAPAAHETAAPVDDTTESLPTATAKMTPNLALDLAPTPAPTPTPISSPKTPTIQGPATTMAPDNSTVGHETMAVNPAPSMTTDSFNVPLPQPTLDQDRSSNVPAAQGESPTMTQLPIRHDRGASANRAPVCLEQPSDASTLPGMRPPSFPISDHAVSPPVEHQESGDLLPAAYRNGTVQLLERLSTDIRSSSMLQEQRAQETTLPGQSLSVRVGEQSAGAGQDPFGASAQGKEDGALFQSNTSGASEPVMRAKQPPLFIDQFMLVRQSPPPPQGTGSPVGASATDQLKLAQGFLDGNHPVTATSTPGMAQTVHLELPSHGSGPLNVRISMADQTVHTQFTTDRSDLGSLLLMRQDQLQQSLTKAGMELGQFQVHINQEGRQETFSDRQFRRHDGALGQQSASQDQDSQREDRERPSYQPTRALSLFA